MSRTVATVFLTVSAILVAASTTMAIMWRQPLAVVTSAILLVLFAYSVVSVRRSTRDD
ncbi:hypothetical protein [Actinokineospora sp. NBRC 105648]|uniref:hypothetical protein n=1 Tax=Actinokineospora sp. NBRC 105648 TaxID=3032206 RepID=UPI00255592E8|nr:hypothetical protein [Actinokineospora sp. NBRC 105648]